MMMTSVVNTGSLLAVDVGANSTRAMLFDLVDGRYRYLAGGESRSTHVAPFFDIREGVHTAVEQIQSITGRVLIGPDEQLIIPCQMDGAGVDTFSATISIEPAVEIFVMGLLDDVSLESAKNLARTIHSHVVGSISITDRSNTETRINKIVHAKPELVIVAGGVESGASQSVLKLLEAVGLAAYLLPNEKKPHILYVGNSELWQEARTSLETIAPITFSDNIRPSLEGEQLAASRTTLANLYIKLLEQRTSGISELNAWAKGSLLPTPAALGRVIQFLSKTHHNKKGVLGVDVSAASVTVAGGLDGELFLNVFPEYGLNEGVENLSAQTNLDEIMRWLNFDHSVDYVREYLANKSLYPATIPFTPRDLDLEMAVLRFLLKKAINSFSQSWPETLRISGETLIAPVEPVLITGDLLNKLPGQAYKILLILDSLQPVGITTLIEDQNRIAAALGAVAAHNPLLTVQLFDTSSFNHLGTVISPVGFARVGTPILKMKIAYSNGYESTLEVKQGTLEVLPLPAGQNAKIHLHPYHRYDVGMGAPGRGGVLKASGGTLGVIIDARGRPLRYPLDNNRRKELFKKWLWMLGGR